MKKSIINKKGVITFHQFNNKSYSAFASLKKEVRIGVLSCLTLTFAAPQSSAGATSMNNPTSFQTSADENGSDDLSEAQSKLELLEETSLLQKISVPAQGTQSINVITCLPKGYNKFTTYKFLQKR